MAQQPAKFLSPGAQQAVNWPCCALPFSHQKRKPTASGRCCFELPLMMPLAAALPAFIGVGGCGNPSSSSVARKGAAARSFMHGAPASASVADAVALLAAFAAAAIEPFIKFPSLLPKQWKPPALLLASGAPRQAAPLPEGRAMPLGPEAFFALGWVAA